MYTSEFRFVSTGVAAANKKRGSMTLEVTPLELVHFLDGEIISNLQDLEDAGVDGMGDEYTVRVSTANSVEATWLQHGSNRRTPPDVRRGERIFLFQYGDSDVYYWISAGLDDELRRLETVVWAFSNTRDEGVRELTPDNSYYVEISTHDKHITIQTNKNDGEPFGYTIQLNTRTGVFTLADDVGNFFELDSPKTKWTMKNKDKTHVILDKKSMYQYAPKLIDHKTTEYNITCETYHLTCKNGTIDASEKFLLNTPVFEVDNNGGAGTTTINGLTTIEQNTVVNGIMGMKQLAMFGGGFVFAAPPPSAAGDFSAAEATVTGGAAEMSMDIALKVNGEDVTVTTGGSFIHDGVDIGKDHEHAGDGGTGSVDSTGPVKV